MQMVSTRATATEIWIKNASRFLVDSGVRIVLVFIRSHFESHFWLMAQVSVNLFDGCDAAVSATDF